MIDKRSLEIGKYTYEVTQLNALAGRKMFVKLANTLGPAFRISTTSQAVIGNLLSNMREEDLDHFCDVFGGQTTVTGGEYEDKTPQLTKALFMTHFAGDYCAMFEWLVFCVVTNFGSFFSGIEGLVKKYAPVEAAKESPKASP